MQGELKVRAWRWVHVGKDVVIGQEAVSCGVCGDNESTVGISGRAVGIECIRAV